MGDDDKGYTEEEAKATARRILTFYPAWRREGGDECLELIKESHANKEKAVGVTLYMTAIAAFAVGAIAGMRDISTDDALVDLIRAMDRTHEKLAIDPDA